MTHPRISHINEVLPAIAGRTDFVVADRGNYQAVDYTYATADTFDDPIRVECRGLKFDAHGNLIARPLHKFFNANERPETQAGILDFSKPHTVMDKLDGSMIHPAIVDDDVVFMTRMGRTDVAKRAERHLTADLKQICFGLLSGGATPIFEWTAPENRIVVTYSESALTLLSIRNTLDGQYWKRDVLEGMGIPLVRSHSDTPRTAAEFLSYARAVQNAEGFVIRFEDGLWLKVKGDDYVMKHKAKGSIVQEKNILALIAAGELDDVLPLLSEEDAATAKAFRDDVERGIAATADILQRFVAEHSDIDQKTFAIEYVSKLPPLLKPLAFNVRKGAAAADSVRSAIKANTITQARVDEYRQLHNAKWAIEASEFLAA